MGYATYRSIQRGNSQKATYDRLPPRLDVDATRRGLISPQHTPWPRPLLYFVLSQERKKERKALLLPARLFSSASRQFLILLLSLGRSRLRTTSPTISRRTASQRSSLLLQLRLLFCSTILACSSNSRASPSHTPNVKLRLLEHTYRDRLPNHVDYFPYSDDKRLILLPFLPLSPPSPFSAPIHQQSRRNPSALLDLPCSSRPQLS